MALRPELQVLTLHLKLICDDFGLTLLTPLTVGRRCFRKRPSDTKLKKMLEELEAADQVRMYEADGVIFGFVPRFRQKLKILRAKHPLPPAELYQDDLNALEKFINNKAMFAKMSPGRLRVGSELAAEVSCSVSCSVSVSDSASVSNDSEASVRLPLVAAAAASASAGLDPSSEMKSFKSVDQWAQDLRLQYRAGELHAQFQTRVVEEIEAQAKAGHRGATQWLEHHHRGPG